MQMGESPGGQDKEPGVNHAVECDYMNEDDIHTILAIALEDPERVEIWASSTPSGRRSYFYRWCTDKSLGWKEFHFPSSILPTWNEEVEREFRESLSELAYLQEIEAEFGEEQAGVFPKKYLDESYQFAEQMGWTEYPSAPYAKKGPRAIGVDWDVYSATPTFVGVEWWPDWGAFRVFLREQLPKTEFTLDNAVNRLIELHGLWDFDYIVVDRGFGEMQVETLKKYGLLHPETHLHERIYAHTFSDKIDVRDPFTKQIEKKPIKPFAVRCTSVALERHHLVLMPGDKQMKKQLEDYRVVSVGQTGNPRYVDKNEHMVDALNLAMLYLTLKHDDLFKYQYTTKVRFIPPPSEESLREIPEKKDSGVRVLGTSRPAIVVPVPQRSLTRRGMPTRFRTIW